MIDPIKFRNGKHCKSCKELKYLTEFYKNNQRKDGRYSECKDCHNSKGKRKVKGIKKRFGISVRVYEEIMKQAGDTCPICKTTYGKPRSSHGKVLDHCHSTGKIRGVICSSCNSALGFSKDSEESLRRMIKWIK